MDQRQASANSQGPDNYPDPSAIPSDGQPFYGNTNAAQPTIEMQVAHHLHSQLTTQPHMGNVSVNMASPTQMPATPHGLPMQASPVEIKTGEKSARSRPKATRACDQCSAKKQGCVKFSPSEDACERCLKHNLDCKYTKPVNKRGPQKGYVMATRALVKRFDSRDLDISKTSKVASNHSRIFGGTRVLALMVRVGSVSVSTTLTRMDSRASIRTPRGKCTGVATRNTVLPWPRCFVSNPTSQTRCRVRLAGRKHPLRLPSMRSRRSPGMLRRLAGWTR